VDLPLLLDMVLIADERILYNNGALNVSIDSLHTN
jgi:hypothetical protein